MVKGPLGISNGKTRRLRIGFVFFVGEALAALVFTTNMMYLAASFCIPKSSNSLMPSLRK